MRVPSLSLQRYFKKYGTSAGSYTTTTAPTYTNAGTYIVYYQVSANNHNTITGSYTITINRAPINYPDSAWEGYYDGNYHSTPSAPSGSNKSGSDGGTNAGPYVATYTPDSNYCWSDRSTSSVDRTVVINRKEIDDPSCSYGKQYNGSMFLQLFIHLVVHI